MSRLAPVSRRHMCSCNWLKLISIWACTLYIGFTKVQLWRMNLESCIALQTLPTKVAHCASQLLLFLVVRIVRCHHWACIISEFLPRSGLLSLCSGGVCSTRHPPVGSRSLIFRRTPVLSFPCFWLLCGLEGRCVPIWAAVISPRLKVYWRKLTVWYGFLRSSTEIGSSKVHLSCYLINTNMRPVRYTVSLVGAYSTWL